MRDADKGGPARARWGAHAIVSAVVGVIGAWPAAGRAQDSTTARPPQDSAVVVAPAVRGPEVPPVALGSRVRAWAPPEFDRSVLATRGTLVAWSPDTLVVADEDHGGRLVAIPYPLLRRLDLSRGIQPRPHGARTGARRGIIVALAITPLLVFQGSHRNDGLTRYARRAAGTAVQLSLEAGVIGAFLGATVLHTAWEPVLVPEQY